MSGRRWLAAAGITDVSSERGPKFDSYALSGEAAAQGWGAALGRIGFIEADIAAGRLGPRSARAYPDGARGCCYRPAST